MPEKKTRLSDLAITKISLVTAGDDPEARVVLVKRKGGSDLSVAQRFDRELAAAHKTLGHAPAGELAKLLFDEVREQDTNDTVLDLIWSRMDSLSESLRDLLWWPEDGADTQALVGETIEQFAEGVTSELGAMFAGLVVKYFDGVDVPVEEREFRTDVSKIFEKAVRLAADPESQSSASGAGGTKEDEMSKKIDLSKLGKEDREAVEKALADGTEAIEKLEGLEAKVAELEKAASEPAEPEEDTELEMLRKASPALAARLEKTETENADLSKKVAAGVRVAKRAGIAKVLVFKSLAAPGEELIDALLDVPEKTFDLLVKTLKAADVAASKGIGSQIGSDQGEDAGEGDSAAWGEVNKLTLEKMAADPTLSNAQAMYKVFQDRDDLYKRTAGNA